MKSKLLILSLTAALLSGACFAKEIVTVSGSTTVLPAMQKIAEAFEKDNPGYSVEISGGGSGSGIKALTDGLTEIAMSSRKIKGEEQAGAESKKVSPYQITVAVDAIVPVLNPKNKIQSLSLSDLRKIFAGEYTNWKELGGDNRPIVVVSRDSSSGTFETWESLVMKKQRITPRALLQTSNGMVVRTVAGNANAIGYVGLGYVSGKVKGLEIDGVKASSETALNGKWPLARDLYLYTNGAPEGKVAKLTDFCLSQKGQGLVKDAGFVPLGK